MLAAARPVAARATAAVREAVERVRVAYDELEQPLRLAPVGDRAHPQVMRHYFGAVGQKVSLPRSHPAGAIECAAERGAPI